MPLTSKERAALRAEAHHLTPAAHIGSAGLTDAVLQSMDDALRTRELIKVQVGRNSPEDMQLIAEEVVNRLGAEIVQTIGKTISVYRHNPDITRRKGDTPPWRVG